MPKDAATERKFARNAAYRARSDARCGEGTRQNARKNTSNRPPVRNLCHGGANLLPSHASVQHGLTRRYCLTCHKGQSFLQDIAAGCANGNRPVHLVHRVSSNNNMPGIASICPASRIHIACPPGNIPFRCFLASTIRQSVTKRANQDLPHNATDPRHRLIPYDRQLVAASALNLLISGSRSIWSYSEKHYRGECPPFSETGHTCRQISDGRRRKRRSTP